MWRQTPDLGCLQNRRPMPVFRFSLIATGECLGWIAWCSDRTRLADKNCHRLKDDLGKDAAVHVSMAQQHILIVEDDAEIAQLLTDLLVREGFRITHTTSGKTVAQIIALDAPDLVLLDVLLPGEDGFSIARRIRAQRPLPIIMLTAMGEEEDRVSGLEIGADDYVTKPFSSRELLARVRAVLRRSDPHGGAAAIATSFAFAGWRLDLRRRELADPASVLVELTSTEFEILRTFCEHAGAVLGRDLIAKLAQGRRVEPYDRSVDTLISRLRAKIEPDVASPALIKTVRHGGYVFTPDVNVETA